MKEYLRTNVILVCLQVRNEPAIVIEGAKHWKNFSYAANQCSQHWMVLGINTALEHITKLEKEIEEVTKETLDDIALTNAKEELEALDEASAEFTYITQQKRLDKLAKDLAKCDKKLTYPFIDEDYSQQDATGKYVNTGLGVYKKYVTFSDTSVSDSSDSELPGPSTGGNQGGLGGPTYLTVL
ncbi:hypothetical protein NDU88_000198 [Pleurodeles waltl]|uniref:Uncharacterized protein n=1 Tax=Pleurodeles waltl TaxID=8319 RepID=A0AAV7WIY0_PLEWA|nr:hypothetical protein NDU88_000198 [Pleurodeles waltl]